MITNIFFDFDKVLSVYLFNLPKPKINSLKIFILIIEHLFNYIDIPSYQITYNSIIESMKNFEKKQLLGVKMIFINEKIYNIKLTNHKKLIFQKMIKFQLILEIF
jgi:hypothetical protein